MDKEKAKVFIDNSFLREFLFDSEITDITYNGADLYYLHNRLGRKKADAHISEEEAKDFIRQVANLTEKQFSFQNPKLDASIGKLRINATHPSIARRNNEHCLNFAIRVAKDDTIINKESTFLNAELIALFEVLVKSHMSIVIGGATGSGKTELQKYLINSMPDFTRIIVIDNVLELDNLDFNRLDINIWQSDDKNKEATVQELVKNALRSNPDWLLVAESRGKEMVEVLNSAMTGHPIITTVHSFDINSIPSRIAGMIMMNEQKYDFRSLMKDIYYHFRFYAFLRRKIDANGQVTRFIEEVAYFDEKGQKTTIYVNKGGERKTYKLTNEVLSNLDYQDNDVFKETFMEEKI